MRFGILKGNILIRFKGRKIHTEDGRTITDPTEEILLQNGYKPIVESGNGVALRYVDKGDFIEAIYEED